MLAPDLETLNLKLTVCFHMLVSEIQPCRRADERALALRRCWKRRAIAPQKTQSKKAALQITLGLHQKHRLKTLNRNRKSDNEDAKEYS